MPNYSHLDWHQPFKPSSQIHSMANDAAEHDLASGRDGHGYPELRTESAVKDVHEADEDEEVVDL